MGPTPEIAYAFRAAIGWLGGVGRLLPATGPGGDFAETLALTWSIIEIADRDSGNGKLVRGMTRITRTGEDRRRTPRAGTEAAGDHLFQDEPLTAAEEADHGASTVTEPTATPTQPAAASMAAMPTAMPTPPATQYWNGNVAHHRMILAAVPVGCRTALDVGCGDGLLAEKLAARAKQVVGVDLAEEMIAQARARVGQSGSDVEFVRGDFVEAVERGYLAGPFDFVCCVTAIHHMEFDRALTAMAGLVAPGGRLFVVGIAMSRSPLDWLIAGTSYPLLLLIRRFHGGKSAPAGMPIKDTTMSYADARRATLRILPDARWRRRLHVRWSLEWTAPPR
jgi:SAM-dependent methyltransferase